MEAAQLDLRSVSGSLKDGAVETHLGFPARRRLEAGHERWRREPRRALEARLAERARIARELHDGLLQSFDGLLLHFAAAARMFASRPNEALKKLNDTIAQTRRAIQDGREAVQGLRSSIEGPEDLAEAISRLAVKLSGSTPSPDSTGTVPQPIGIRVAVEGKSRRLHPIVRDELYRVAAEALRNALRHAQATQIEVELRYGLRQFELHVRDDGRGIDPELIAPGDWAGHFGLKGMRERAEVSGGKLTVWSAPGVGTEIEAAIPASRAYAPLDKLTGGSVVTQFQQVPS